MADYNMIKSQIISQVNINEVDIDTRLKQIDAEIAKWEEAKKEAAREGDLRENAGYDDACNNLQQLQVEKVSLVNAKAEAKAAVGQVSLSALVARARGSEVVAIGKLVVLSKEGAGMTEELYGLVVPEGIAIPHPQTIQTNSPLGMAILDKKVGDIVTCATPAGLLRYKIKALH